MITLPICLFLAVFANVNSEIINGVIDAPISTTPAPPLKEGDKCDSQSINNIVCENDRLKFCGPTNIITSSPCIVRGRPGFCNCEKTECVAEKPNCPNGDTEECFTPNTKLPDNLNCHKFSYCNENGKKLVLQCPGDLIYDPNTQRCTDRTMARCLRVMCPRMSNTLQLVPFPQAKNYYVLCYQGIGDVRKCSDKFYTAQNNACLFDCDMVQKSGVFRDTNLENCRKGIFYSCKRLGGSFSTLQFKCSPGQYFDEDLGVCTATDTCEQSTNPPQQ